MQVFELHFNPRKKDDRIFDSFVYEPESPEERGRGNLYIAGELIKALPQNTNFLNNLSSHIKDDYYQKASFQEALRGANSFLDKETREGNVGWLGNLNFAALCFEDSILNFTKVGNIKILLIREGEVLDISQNLELQDTEPYSLKVFGNMASGKLSPEDKILILTKEIFLAVAQNEGFLNQIGQITNQKELKRIFGDNKDVLSEISGICLLLVPSDLKIPRLHLPHLPKKIILIFALIILLAIAFFLFGNEKEEELGMQKQTLKEAQSKIIMAESLLILQENTKAQVLFQEAWEMLLPLTKSGQSPGEEAASLQKSIEQYLIK